MVFCALTGIFRLYPVEQALPQPTSTEAIQRLPTHSASNTTTALPLATGTTSPESQGNPIFAFTPESISTVIAPLSGSALIECIRAQEPQVAQVVLVVDGDTIRVSMNGVNATIRYIGIDTPENTTKIEYFGAEASKKNQELVLGQEITMYRDTSETDRYDRLLRYIFVGEHFINYELVAEGYAQSLRYPPDTACADLFEQAEKQARGNGLGLWSATAT